MSAVAGGVCPAVCNGCISPPTWRSRAALLRIAATRISDEVKVALAGKLAAPAAIISTVLELGFEFVMSANQADPFHMVDLILKKRDGGSLTAREIGFIVRGAANESIPVEQLAGWLLA